MTTDSILRSPAIWVVGFYAVVSLVTFMVYAADKSAATSGRWRTPERTLHLLSVSGGWPGAMLAQHWLRHKSSKRGFRRVFWVTVALNLAALGYLTFPAIRRLLLAL